MKAKLLSFVFRNFSESSLFKGLQPKKIKKFLACVTRVKGCGPNMSNSTRAPFRCSSIASTMNEASINIVVRVSGFGKKISPELSIFLKSRVPLWTSALAPSRERRAISSTLARFGTRACKLRGLGRLVQGDEGRSRKLTARTGRSRCERPRQARRTSPRQCLVLRRPGRPMFHT
jgi:Holliday junction resolvasome RuvABC DNA-binding subunit